MPYAVAVDIGGTFTDLVAYDAETRRVAYAKSPTTYGNLVDGVLDCFGKAKLEPRAASFVNHGTTLVINALIQRKGAKAALVTTKGFRDVLEIARGNRPDPFDLHYRRDEPLIPRVLRFEVAKRIGSNGERATGTPNDRTWATPSRRRSNPSSRGSASWCCIARSSRRSIWRRSRRWPTSSISLASRRSRSSS